MRDASPGARSLPSLLDRLTDDDPAERRDAEHKRFASTKQLRDSVLRDLSWLLNSVRLSSVQELSGFPQVAKSVLNFGLPDLTGRMASSVDRPELERQLCQAIRHFEPRLLPQTVVVQVVTAAHESRHNNLQLSIDAKLEAHPVPLYVRLRSDIDLETGEVSIAEWERERLPVQGHGAHEVRGAHDIHDSHD
jgi:type VI secretion system protein ImpF